MSGVLEVLWRWRRRSAFWPGARARRFLARTTNLPRRLAEVPAWTIPSDARIRATLADGVDGRHVAPGFVVGIIEPTGRRVIVYGRRDADDPRPLDGKTLFEMGSITKLFTALLLTDMAARDEVKLDDPAVGLAGQWDEPCRRGQGGEITLLDLVTHTSGPAGLSARTSATAPRSIRSRSTAKRSWKAFSPTITCRARRA